MSLQITFYGAAGTVTGSKYLVEDGKNKILVDAGLFQGLKELRLRNWEQPQFDPKELTAIVLTHAHIDHTGFLPLLVRQGFRGDVYCSKATKELCELLLPDSAHLQEEEARFANLHGTSKHHPAKPLYTSHDAKQALSQLKGFDRRSPITVAPGVTLTAKCAGHILGACAINLDIGGRRITFSGDIGRYGEPILPDPQPIEIGDLLLCESTYGDRLHEKSDVEDSLQRCVKAAALRRGPLIIPAFAVGRTQTLLFHLSQLERSGKIPELPVFVDSPMAVDATEIYRRHSYDHDEETVALMREGETPFATARVTFCHSVEESKRLNTATGPRIIISASGMVTGGRILHHLRNWLPREETTVLFVGYQAKGTRGDTIQSGAREVKIFGQYVPIRATVESIGGLSAHGDRDELLRWLASCSGSPKQVKIVHGEPPASAAFAQSINEKFGWRTTVAEHQETVEV